MLLKHHGETTENRISWCVLSRDEPGQPWRGYISNRQRPYGFSETGKRGGVFIIDRFRYSVKNEDPDFFLSSYHQLCWGSPIWIFLLVAWRVSVGTRSPELGMIEARIQPFLFQELFVSGTGFGTVSVLNDTALI